MGEVLVSDLQVMLGCDQLAVAEPGNDDVERIGLGQLSLMSAAKILKELRPRGQPCLVDDPQELCPQVNVAVAVASDDELLLHGRASQRSEGARQMSLATQLTTLTRRGCDFLPSDLPPRNLGAIRA